MKTSTDLLNHIMFKKEENLKSLAVLIDPDEIKSDKIENLLSIIPDETDYIFVGGSQVKDGKTDLIIKILKNLSSLPIIIFPGHFNQISSSADAILFLSLMSGDNPEYLIHQQIKSVDYLKHSQLEIIPTGYILIDGGKQCTTERITNTKAIPQTEIKQIVHTALAAQYSGKQLIYLEAGSGANYPVHPNIIKEVKQAIKTPLIVGGGIRSSHQKEEAYAAGADIIVMGTVFEDQIL